MSAGEVVIRPADEGDIPAICAIYRWEVLNRAATFELSPPDEAEMLSRMRDILAGGFPYLAAESRGADKDNARRILAGYAYASPFRSRLAYRFTVEDSIYVSPDFQRRGVGLALLRALLTECERRGFRQMMAVISDPENGGSAGFHRKAGFQKVGTLENVGWKFGRWISAVVATRPLGPGAKTPPEEREKP